MTHLAPRPWVPAASESLVQRLAAQTLSPSTSIAARIDQLIDRNQEIHDADCFNLNPATNVMNPRAEAALARGLGSRPSLGYPGDKYEMGLEAIEEIEVITAALASEIFGARYAEIRVGSGALANLYGFMALAKPGDSIIAPRAASAATSPTTPPAARASTALPPTQPRSTPMAIPLISLHFATSPMPSGRRSSPSAAASTSSPIRWPRCARSPIRSARRSSSTPPTNAASSRGASGPTRSPKAPIW